MSCSVCFTAAVLIFSNKLETEENNEEEILIYSSERWNGGIQCLVGMFGFCNYHSNPLLCANGLACYLVWMISLRNIISLKDYRVEWKKANDEQSEETFFTKWLPYFNQTHQYSVAECRSSCHHFHKVWLLSRPEWVVEHSRRTLLTGRWSSAPLWNRWLEFRGRHKTWLHTCRHTTPISKRRFLFQFKLMIVMV